jgi:hypothetical protein
MRFGVRSDCHPVWITGPSVDLYDVYGAEGVQAVYACGFACVTVCLNPALLYSLL